MKRFFIAVITAMLVVTTGYCADEAQAPKEFGGVVAGIAITTAVVTSVDRATRTVTLKGDDGQEASIVCGPEVRNFDQIRKGDKVKIDYTERVKVIVSELMTIPQRRDEVLVSRAPLGNKPSGVIVASSQVLATVEAIDYEKRTLRLKGPQRTLDIEVSGEAPNFNRIRTGDTVYLEITATTAISVTK